MPERSNAERSHTVSNYCGLMSEVKARIEGMSSVVGLAADGKLAPRFAADFCFLQLRMICELIALGCLIAHDDIPMTRSGKMRKLWSTTEILNALEKLHPDFYPIPTGGFFDADGKPVDISSPKAANTARVITSGYLTKSDLLALTGKCGKELHRGTLKTLFGPKPKDIDFRDIEKVNLKISRLLSFHEIALIDSNYRMWIQMVSQPDNKVRGKKIKKLNS